MSDLHCYCCGETLPEQFALVSMNKEADRVFVMLLGHEKRVDDPRVIVYVKRKKAA